MQDENLTVSNARIVDSSWKLLYTLGSKNLNKILEPRFEITLVCLGNNDATA